MEVLLALVVIAFGLYGILDLMAANLHLSQRAQNRGAAIELAGAKMAEIQAAGFGAIEPLLPKLSDESSTAVLYPPAPDRFQSPYQAEKFYWQARFDRNPQVPEVLNVEVRVYWYPKAGTRGGTVPQHSVSVGGLLVKR